MMIRHLFPYQSLYISRCISYIAVALLLVFTTSCTTHYSNLKTTYSPTYNPNQGPVAVKNQPAHNYPVQRPIYAPVIVEQQPTMQQQEYQNSPVPSSTKARTVVDPVAVMDAEIKPTLEPSNSRLDIAEYNQTLFLASEQGDTDLINAMIRQGANVSSTNTNGETALHSAAAHNQVDAAMILIEKGADVNAQTISGWTPLHSAARFGSVDVINLLMGTGSMPQLRNNDGKSTVDLARQAGHDSAVRALLIP